MREYEVMIVIQPELDEEARDEVIKRVAGWLTHGEGEEAAPKSDHWGMRTLAYPIRNYTDGYYVLFEAEMDPGRVNQTEREILYVDDILRHLVVRKNN